ncbi:hypothetical protein MVEN_00754200 [Mycena venus]|uniref:Zn(2)-C6 fungal-type domain-containing protein n=1 Tax=Mycena venus TaxID=2733690 RepID=A0A8H7D657_9AGAR|nr:hypothetical protein MVEN_00754200 [Mycena venus]
MKRSRQQVTQIPSISTRRSKGIQACTSCRKNKTRCEILDTTTSPVQCHRCKVIGIHCSYEETLAPTVPESPSPPAPITSANSSNIPDSSVRPRPDPYPSAMPPDTRIWQFVNEDRSETIDWSAPMLAIQNLARLPAVNPNFANLPSSSSLRETHLENILSLGQIQYLLELFDHKYSPWLNFKLIRHSNSGLLDTICCSVASRYLDMNCSAANPDLDVRLQVLTEDLVIKIIFNPRVSESVEAIQALLILSLWDPIGGPENEGRDGRVLLASAVSMAMNLRLNQASARAEALQKSSGLNGGYMAEADVVALNELLEHARLWVSLTNAESMLCIGTGRVPLSRRSPEDKKLIEFPESFVGLTDYRNLRLGLVSMQATTAEEGVALRIKAPSDIDGWYEQMTKNLESLKRGRRLLLPLPVILDHEQAYFHILHVYDGICRLLLLYHALREAKVAVGHIPAGEIWHRHFLPHGVPVIPEWGRDMIRTGEAILVYACQADADLLSTAPDVFFHMITLAASYVVGVKFLMYRKPGVVHPRGARHSAHKCALLINGMIAKWERRGTMDQRPVAPKYSTPSSSDSDGGSYAEGYYSNNSPLTSPPELDFSIFLNQMMGMDADFWKELQNQELDVGYQ